MGTDRLTRVVGYRRIVVSGVCLVACVLLIALRVRSHWWEDMLAYSRTRHVTVIGSKSGVIYVGQAMTTKVSKSNLGWNYWAVPARPSDSQVRQFPIWARDKYVSIPHWSLVPLACTLAALAALPRRFSLSTLLIMTTVVAVVLGLAVSATS